MDDKMIYIPKEKQPYSFCKFKLFVGSSDIVVIATNQSKFDKITWEGNKTLITSVSYTPMYPSLPGVKGLLGYYVDYLKVDLLRGRFSVCVCVCEYE